jgi:TPR repeat protein
MGCQQDHAKAKGLFTKAADLGCSKANWTLADIYREEGDLKKAKFHLEAAAMAGHEAARCNLGAMEFNSGNLERAIKHWTIAASAGNYGARALFEDGVVSPELIDSTLTAFNSSCAEFRSEA